MRVLFVGMTGHFSLRPLQILLRAPEVEIVGVLVPGQGQPHRIERPPLPLGMLQTLQLHNIVQLAWSLGIPVFEARSFRDLSTLEPLQPDIIAVACFPRLLPARFRALARLAAVNVHPSLLPKNRGPDPIGWTISSGERQTGVTIHLLSDKADAGDILAQAPLDVPPGTTRNQLEVRCANLGGELLLDVIRQLTAGTANPIPQDDSQATHHS
ncbi:MAG: methionyl-tRNA formyltransferase [Chloroflexi bacterium]|nr:methionyl-tRNA formyltransferase [Chloroflexota bacterium]